MKGTFTQSMAWLHTWSGLIFGWVLFIIFVGGTLAVFDKEITGWMEPELSHVGPLTDEGLAGTIAFLSRTAPDAPSWRFSLPGPRDPAIRTSVRSGKGRGAPETTATLDPSTGDVIETRKTTGGSFFFTLHYSLYAGSMPGIWLVGAAGMAMLAALVTGVITHRRIFKDFFTFRPTSSSQRSWLDAHNVTGVLVLPFYFMIAFTGVVIFYATFMPSGLYALYAKDPAAYFTEIARFSRPGEPAKEKAPLTAIAPLVRAAEKDLGGGSGIWFVQIANPGRTNAQVAIYQRDGARLALTRDHIVFNGVTGAVTDRIITEKPDAIYVYKVMSGLHFAQFGGYTVRWLYFICGVAGSAMIATGLVLFTVKRRRKQGAKDDGSPFFFRLAEALNMASIAGLPVASLAYFWVNRLVPARLAERSEWEVRAFFAIWLLMLACALLRAFLPTDDREKSIMRGWIGMFSLAAFLSLGLPILNALSGGENLAVAIGGNNWQMAAVDITALVSGIVFLIIAGHLRSGSTHRDSRQKKSKQKSPGSTSAPSVAG